MTRFTTTRAAWALLAMAGAAGGAWGQTPQHYVATPIPAGEVPPMVPPSGDSLADMDWMTMDSGGGPLTGAGGLLLEGTFGQPDPGMLTNGVLQMAGGFWTLFTAPVGVACWANCDSSSQPPVLNVADFTCFVQRYAAQDPWANCDGSSQSPVLNVADFTCFLQKYAAGCP